MFLEHIFPFQGSLSTDSSDSQSHIAPFTLPPNENYVTHAAPTRHNNSGTSPTSHDCSHSITPGILNPVPPSNPVIVPLTKSTRTIQPPIWLYDFVTPVALYASSFNLHHNKIHECHDGHVAFLTNLLSIKEPTTYHHAKLDPLWVDAINKELQAL